MLECPLRTAHRLIEVRSLERVIPELKHQRIDQPDTEQESHGRSHHGGSGRGPRGHPAGSAHDDEGRIGEQEVPYPIVDDRSTGNDVGEWKQEQEPHRRDGSGDGTGPDAATQQQR